MLTNRRASCCPERALKLLTKVNETHIGAIAAKLGKSLRPDALAHPGRCCSSTFQRTPLVLLAAAKLHKAAGADEFADFVTGKNLGARLRTAFDWANKSTLGVAGEHDLLPKSKPACRGKQPGKVGELEMRLAMLAALDSAIQAAELETRVNFKLLSLSVALSQLELKCNRRLDSGTGCRTKAPANPMKRLAVAKRGDAV